MPGASAGAALAADNRYGDTTWVAPEAYLAPDGTDPTKDGPRVAEPDRARPAETLLRLPFRFAFLPLRLVARGAEAAAGFVGPRVVSQGRPRSPSGGGWSIGPLVQYSGSAGPGLGPSITGPAWLGDDGRLSIGAYWTWNDQRRVRVRQTIGARGQPLGGRLELGYRFRPNGRFYGLGNFSSKQARSIYLEEEGNAAASVHLGPDRRRQLRVTGGWSSISSRRGYNDGPAAADLFTEAEVPYLLRESQMVYYGAGAEAAALDDLRDPALGVHGFVDVLRFESADDSETRYVQTHSEARVYVPVLSRRRVLALQVLHRGVNPDGGSGPIPFYRLPESRRELGFAGYKGGRFRDRHLALAHLEYRWKIVQDVWATGFAELGEVASRARRLRLADAHESYGGGLRYAPSVDTVLRVEMAGGAEGARVTLDLNGTF